MLHIRIDDYKYVKFQQNGEVANHGELRSRPWRLIYLIAMFLLCVDSEAMSKENFQLVLSQVQVAASDPGVLWKACVSLMFLQECESYSKIKR